MVFILFYTEQQTDHGEEAASSHQSLSERVENTHPGRHEERRKCTHTYIYIYITISPELVPISTIFRIAHTHTHTSYGITITHGHPIFFVYYKMR